MKLSESQLHNRLLTELQHAITELADREQDIEDYMQTGKEIPQSARSEFYYWKGKVHSLDLVLELMR